MAHKHHRSHKSVSKGRERLPYCPNLGEHHMNFDAPLFKRAGLLALRNHPAFLMPTFVAPPPQHTLIHRSLENTPLPSRMQMHNILGVIVSGMDKVLDMDIPTTNHYRWQYAIANMDFDEAVDRLNKKMYVTKIELARL